MQYRRIEGPSFYRLELTSGADLFQSLRDFLKQETLSEAYVLYGIGSLDKVVLAYPKTQEIPPEIERSNLEGLFEINVIAGEVRSVGQDVKVHLHGSITRAGREVFGGAIIEGTRIFKVAELVLIGVE